MSKSRKALSRKLRTKAHWKEVGFILLMLAIPFANFLVFWLYPNLRSITIAFEVPSIEDIFKYRRRCRAHNAAAKAGCQAKHDDDLNCLSARANDERAAEQSSTDKRRQASAQLI